MSVKDVKKYYAQVCADYKELQDNIKDFEEAVSNNIFEPERLEEYKKSIEPFKANYERITYIMYLLNQPVKKEKMKKYERQNQKLIKSLSKSNSIESQLAENKEVLEKTKVKQ